MVAEAVTAQAAARWARTPAEVGRWRHWYLAYRRSEAWKARRRAALERAGWRCQTDCGRRATQVHHLDYARVGREAPEDLVALCADCHRAAHGRGPLAQRPWPQFTAQRARGGLLARLRAWLGSR